MKKKKDEELAKATVGTVSKGRAAVKTLTIDYTISEDLNATTALSTGKKSKIASPKPLLSEEEIRQREEQEKVQIVKADFVATAVRDHNICKEQIERFEQIHQKIKTYQNDKGALPIDSDGIYYIVGGMGCVIN